MELQRTLDIINEVFSDYLVRHPSHYEASVVRDKVSVLVKEAEPTASNE